MMTSEGETLLWSSYMFFANSMSTATYQWEKRCLKKKKRNKKKTKKINSHQIIIQTASAKINICGNWWITKIYKYICKLNFSVYSHRLEYILPISVKHYHNFIHFLLLILNFIQSSVSSKCKDLNELFNWMGSKFG